MEVFIHVRIIMALHVNGFSLAYWDQNISTIVGKLPPNGN